MTKINRTPQDIVDIIAEHDAEIRRLRRLLTRNDTYATMGWVEDNFVRQPNGGGATGVQVGVASEGGLIAIGPAGGATGVQVGVNAVGGFDLESIAGLRVWLDAARLTGLNDGDPVASWPNLVAAESESFTQSDPAARPLYRTAQQNGLPGVSFDGTGDHLDGSVARTLKPVTVFQVVRRTGTALFMTVLGATADPTFTTRFRQDVGNRMQLVLDPVVPIGTSASEVPLGAASVWDLSYGATGAWLIGYDGADDASGTNDQTAPPPTVLSLGARLSSDRFWNGLIHEVLIYDTVLSSTDRQLVRDYLVGKWFQHHQQAGGETGVQIVVAATGAGEEVTPAFPSLRSVSTAAEVDSTQITITKPSGVVSGDLLVAFVIGTWLTGASWNTPSGWTARTLRTEVLGSSQATSRIFTKVAGSSEPTSYTFTLTGTMRLGGDIMAFANSSGVGATGSNQASSQVVNGITTTAANSLLLMISAVLNPSTTALPSGMTSAISHNTDDNHRTAAYEERPTVGATGTRSFAGSTVNSHGHAIEILAI